MLAARLLAELKGRAPAAEAPGWPPGYFDSTVGSITDGTFVRHPQADYEKRLEME